MNKLELISELKAEANISKAEAARVVQGGGPQKLDSVLSSDSSL
jgi:nucleoid DNA-binding protein